MTTTGFTLKPELAEFIHWSRRGTCGNPGCADPECCCSLCTLPIDEEVPIMLFRGLNDCEQARFHDACFEKLLLPRRKPVAPAQ